MATDHFFVSALLDLFATASRKAHVLRDKAQDVEPVLAIVDSLRHTLAMAFWHRSRPEELVPMEFSLTTNQSGDPIVQHHGRTLPVSEGFVSHLLREAGVKLRKEQVVLLTGEFVKIVVEEALAHTAALESQLRFERATLLTASLAAEKWVLNLTPVKRSDNDSSAVA